MTRLIKTITLGIAISALCACNGKSATQEAAPNTQLLSSLALRDDGLKFCVEEAAKKNGWTRVDQVVELNCPYLSKTRERSIGQLAKHEPLDARVHPIFDASEIGLFDSLKKLDLAGNFYTKIDLRKLTRLEELNLFSAFLQDLDLSANKKLVVADLAGLGLQKLDLTGLVNLKELYVSYTRNISGGRDIHQDTILHTGAGLYGLDEKRFLTPKVQLKLDRAASLRVVETSLSTLIDLENNKLLESVKGLVTARSLENAPALKEFVGEIKGEGVLDLKHTSALEEIVIHNKEIIGVEIAKNLKTLTLPASVKSLVAPADSSLARLTIEGNGGDTFWFGRGMIDLQQLPISEVKLNNYNSAAVLDLSASTTIESLTLTNSKLDSINLSPSVVKLSLTKTSARVVQPVNQLQFYATDNCALNDIPLVNVKSLALGGCQVPALDLSLYPKLTSLRVGDSKLASLDFKSAPQLISLYLFQANVSAVDFTHAQALNDLNVYFSEIGKMDFSPLAGRQRSSLTFLSYELTNAAELQQQARSIFANVRWDEIQR